MSQIDYLIDELCPEGVKFRFLADLGRRNSGTTITAEKMKALAVEGGDVRVFAGGQTVADVSEGTLPEKDIVRSPSIVVKSRGYIGFVYYDKPFTHKSELWSYTLIAPEVEQKFVYYYLLTKQNQLQELARATSVKIPQLAVRDTDNLKIPVPPLEIQRKIVKILDAFTKLGAKLEAELRAELEARQKQYRYYREELLSFEGRGDIPRVTLGGLGEFVRGTGIQKADFCDTGVGCIHYGQIHTHYGVWAHQTKSYVSFALSERLRKAKFGNLVIATTSEDDNAVAKAVAWLGDEDVAVSTDAYIYRHTLNPKYVSYFFQTENFQSQKMRFITGTKVRRISGESLAKINIPVPSLEEQTRIVDILDKFDALVNDISSGLPAEISARRQQSEHYRDKLLSFKEAA